MSRPEEETWAGHSGQPHLRKSLKKRRDVVDELIACHAPVGRLSLGQLLEPALHVRRSLELTQGLDFGMAEAEELEEGHDVEAVVRNRCATEVATFGEVAIKDFLEGVSHPVSARQGASGHGRTPRGRPRRRN